MKTEGQKHGEERLRLRDRESEGRDDIGIKVIRVNSCNLWTKNRSRKSAEKGENALEKEEEKWERGKARKSRGKAQEKKGSRRSRRKKRRLTQIVHLIEIRKSVQSVNPYENGTRMTGSAG